MSGELLSGSYRVHICFAAFLYVYSENADSKATAQNGGVDPDVLAKILSNPEMMALLTTLAQSMK